MSIVTTIRDQYIRRNAPTASYIEGLDLVATADPRYPAKYAVTLRKTATIKPYEVRRQDTWDEWLSALADARTALRADGWELARSEDESI